MYHFHDPELMLVAFFFRMLGKRIVFDMHENFPLQILTKTYMPVLAKKTLSTIAKKSQQLIFGFIPVIFAENSYHRHFPKTCLHTTILNFPLLRMVDKIKGEKRDKFTLGYMGGVNIERGTIIILRAIQELVKKGHDIEVVFIGPYNEEITSTEIYQDSIKEGWATFFGRLKPEEGWSKMAECNAGLAVLQNSPNYIESYPTKLFEYMLLELPTIVSNFPLYRQIVEECNCGIAVEPSSVNEVCNAILTLYTSPKMCLEMGKRGKSKAAEKYSWESEYSKLKKFYSKVLLTS
ncbi:glycosyltransferase [Flagellimonas sp. S3867]|uniref:glycosyltransferase n=1 Tax=Flagellimonas sp. S3867 TaxID=2768063 RepID=UPI001CC2375F|nr:glycosyltransferase [Flagellimonas sp. S3867]